MNLASTNSLAASRSRDLLNDLRAAIQARRQAEEELAELEAAGADPSVRELERAIEELSRTFQEDLAAANDEAAARRQAIEASFQSASAAVEAEYRRSVQQVQQTFAVESARIESQYEENRWMLSSILDDESDNSPKRQYELLKAQLQQSREYLAAQAEELQRLLNEAVELAERRRLRSDLEIEVPAVPAAREEAIRRFDAAALAARDSFARMKRQAIPQLFAGWSAPILGLVVWLALFAGSFPIASPALVGLDQSDQIGRVILSGGIGLAGSALALFVLYGIAGRQNRSALQPLLAGVAEAQTCRQHWLRLAKEELQAREADYHERYTSIVAHREKALQQFETKRADALAELESRRDHELHEAAQRRAAALQEMISRRDHELASADADYRNRTETLRTEFETRRDHLIGEQQQRTAERRQKQAELWDRLTQNWIDALARLAGATADLQEQSGRAFPDWSQIAAAEWTPPAGVPPGIRIGDYTLDLRQVPNALPEDERLVPDETAFRLPAVLPFPEAPSLLIKAAGPGRADAVSMLQVSMLRLLTQLPPGKVRFTVVDPVGLGENFAAFMHLADFDDLLISSRIWTETAHIEQQLANLTEHMENVFQKYLRNEFETIEQYNEHAGEVAEPYRILVVANFPAGFSERAAQRLVSIAASGARCGVYTLVSVDTRQPLPRGFDLSNLEAGATVLQWEQDRFVNRGLGPEPLPLVIDPSPPPPLFAAIVRKMGDLSKHVRRVEVPFHRIAPSEERVWSRDSRAMIEIPLGRAGATKLQHLRLGMGTSQHALVAGKTGSGKSTLLHVVITNLALHYSPDQIEFYLIDFKKGVEFKTYATHRLPHARVIAIESDREFGTSALERLDAILKERGDLFRQQGVQDIEAFRDARPDVPMPRILLIVDEFQEFFVEDDRYSQTAALLLDRLVRQGRAFGIHVLLGSQTLGGAYSLARTTIGQMAVRIALQCSETDAHLILSEDNSAARLLTRPGEAIYNDANGMLEGNSPFQIAWLGDDEHEAFLERIARLGRERGLRPAEPVVFEGNIPADPSRNAALRDVIEAADGRSDSMPRVWLGEAVAITGPASVAFRRQSGSNLLIVGQSPGAAAGMLSACLVALSAQLRNGTQENGEALLPRFLLFSGAAGSSDKWRPVIDAIAHPVRTAGPDNAAGSIAEVAAEVARRQQERTTAPPVFLLIDDLSRFRDLKKSDDDFGFGGFDREKAASPAQLFADVLRDGPSVGVHVIVWCDSYNNVDRWFSRQLLREFEMRVAFQMSAADSSNLIDSPAAARLGVNRALLYLDERGTTEKFRPYGPPAEEWLHWVRERLKPVAERRELEYADDVNLWTVL